MGTLKWYHVLCVRSPEMGVKMYVLMQTEQTTSELGDYWCKIIKNCRTVARVSSVISVKYLIK